MKADYSISFVECLPTVDSPQNITRMHPLNPYREQRNRKREADINTGRGNEHSLSQLLLFLFSP